VAFWPRHEAGTTAPFADDEASGLLVVVERRAESRAFREYWRPTSVAKHERKALRKPE